MKISVAMVIIEAALDCSSSWGCSIKAPWKNCPLLNSAASPAKPENTKYRDVSYIQIHFARIFRIIVDIYITGYHSCSLLNLWFTFNHLFDVIRP